MKRRAAAIESCNAKPSIWLVKPGINRTSTYYSKAGEETVTM
jgi:hypothetical protein